MTQAASSRAFSHRIIKFRMQAPRYHGAWRWSDHATYNYNHAWGRRRVTPQRCHVPRPCEGVMSSRSFLRMHATHTQLQRHEPCSHSYPTSLHGWVCLLGIVWELNWHFNAAPCFASCSLMHRNAAEPPAASTLYWNCERMHALQAITTHMSQVWGGRHSAKEVTLPRLPITHSITSPQHFAIFKEACFCARPLIGWVLFYFFLFFNNYGTKRLIFSSASGTFRTLLWTSDAIRYMFAAAERP